MLVKEKRERSPVLGLFEHLEQTLNEKEALSIFRKTCRNKYFEFEVAKAFDSGKIKMPIYLSIGSEHVPASISEVNNDFMIFAQHRAHSYYMSFGGDLEKLRDELLHKETGCAKGMGGSASIHSPEINMFGHSGHMGDQIPIAVGAALASGKKTLAVMGDASGEEDYVQGALGYAATKKVPVLFICEDNDLSILTPVSTRRSWSIVDVCHAYGINAVDITDDPWLIAHHVKTLELPALINIRTCRDIWHAGTGHDGLPEWNRFELIKQKLNNLNYNFELIESEEKAKMEALWA
jgi:acetoin:2,6-dichlorophenolindophenol oxidoreductase subunit alpha